MKSLRIPSLPPSMHVVTNCCHVVCRPAVKPGTYDEFDLLTPEDVKLSRHSTPDDAAEVTGVPTLEAGQLVKLLDQERLYICLCKVHPPQAVSHPNLGILASSPVCSP